MDSGQPGRVVAMREEFRAVMAERHRETIEQLTGRKVVAFLSQAHVESDITVEMRAIVSDSLLDPLPPSKRGALPAGWL
jgi:uncharacterized protein YbcI